MRAEYLHTYYNQDWVYKNIKEYFSIGEFFHPQMTKRYSEAQLWSFLDFRMLSNLLYVRITRDRSITINSGKSQSRGFRSILNYIVIKYALAGKLYASAHGRGAGIDFNEEDTRASVTRNWIVANGENLPFKCRLENTKGGHQISWVHIDSDYFANYKKVHLFNV